MNVLFVASGNLKINNENIIVERQAESLNRGNINVDRYYIIRKGAYGYLISIFKIRKLVKKFNYDIIHAHYGWCGLVSLLTFTSTKKIISFMGDDLIGSVNKKNRYSFTSKIVSKFNIFLANNCYDYIIVKSENLIKKLKTVNNKILIPNGVNLFKFYEIDKGFAKKELGWSLDKKYILFVSNPDRTEKNFALAKDSIELLNNSNIVLFITANIPGDKLYLYYNAAECLILTSIHEGSPNVIKEAMVCGCPVISTDVGDVKWIFGNIEGCHLTSFEPQDVAGKIKLALEFSEKYGRTRGRERILELGLDSETIAAKIVEVYKKVLKIED